MTVQRELLAAARRDVEQKIRAVEEWNNLRLENAHRVEMYAYGHSKRAVFKEIHDPESQLCLWSKDCFLYADDKSFRKF